MLDDASDFRAPALAWAAARVEDQPWAEASGRAALLIVTPPRALWATAEVVAALRPSAWLVLDAGDVRLLPEDRRTPLMRHGVLFEELPEGDLAVFVAEALDGLLQDVSRRALESRWLIAHAEAVHDPLRRLETLERAALALPRGSDERILRLLYLALHEALAVLEVGGLPVLGEAAAAVYRLLCVIESGLHPPLEWLAFEARAAALADRVVPWVEDLTRTLAGDEGALRRVLAGRSSVLRALTDPTRQRVGAPDWLSTPRAYALRPPR